jgi:uncharacterized protein (DUF983 family)
VANLFRAADSNRKKTMAQTISPKRGRLEAIFLLRCPVCLDGKVFHSFMGMNKSCPECGIVFERESGYFLSSMFIAYVIGFLILVPVSLGLYIMHVTGGMQVSGLLFWTVIIGLTAVLWPFIFRYSRVIWMHADQMMDPREIERG